MTSAKLIAGLVSIAASVCLAAPPTARIGTDAAVRLDGDDARLQFVLFESVRDKYFETLNEKAERVALTGPGVLEMAQPARFAGCRGVRLDGVTLKAPGKVSLVLRDCTDVAVDGVTARTEMRNCREVRGVAETGKIRCDR